MTLKSLIFLVTVVEAFVIDRDNNTNILSVGNVSDEINIVKGNEENAATVFNGVYRECFLYLSYSCLQKKTLLYLKELNKLSEVSVIGEYVKFVKVNETDNEDLDADNNEAIRNSEELSFLIDRAVDKFFNNHILKFTALGKDVSIPQTVEEFVGRKRKGGGGGGGHGGGGGGDGGKKKMMMMAMMCMKMKLMMMVPAMMGMMGMMSFKGMMFSMMSFMVSKMMLLMKILEKKGGGGGGGGGGDGSWAAGGGGGGGAWMPAGGQDYGGGGGGGYDANGQWQGRSNDDVTGYSELEPIGEQQPVLSYVTPLAKYNNKMNERTSYSSLKALNDEILKINQKQAKSRKKRGITDMLQNAYIYWLNQLLGLARIKRFQPKYPKFKIINGVKYVYYPLRQIPKQKAPKELPQIETKPTETPIITGDDFNKGEIVDGPVESRMTKKLQTFKDDVNEALEDNPWQ